MRVFTLLFLPVFVFSAYYVVSDDVWRLSGTVEGGQVYILVDDLPRLGFEIVGNPSRGKVYLFHGDHIVALHQSGRVVLDFVEVLSEDGALFLGSTVYLSADLVAQLIGREWIDLPGGGMAIFLKGRRVTGIEVTERSYFIQFDSPVPEEMVGINSRNDSIELVIHPLDSVEGIPKGVEWSFEDGTLRVVVPLKPHLRAIYHMGRKNFEVRFVPQAQEFFGRMKIADGIVFSRIKEKIDGKEMVLDVLDVDLRKAEIVPEISAAGIGSLETVKSMVERTGAVAGVNASYFDPKTSLPVGLIVKDGKPLSATFGGRPIFIITDDREAIIGKLFVEVNAIVGDTLLLVKGVNTIAKGDVILFTDDYAKAVPKDDERLYIVGSRGKVIGFGYRKFLKDGEYMISVDPKLSKYLRGLREGDIFRIRLVDTFDLPIRHAVEAGPLILLNGEPLNEQLSEKHRYGGGLAFYKASRTVVAIKGPKAVSFIVTEGKVDYDDMVDYLMRKGYVSAMFLDGGSSSTMVVKDMVYTGNGRERYVASALLVFPRR